MIPKVVNEDYDLLQEGLLLAWINFNPSMDK